jgi:hypothetical protein
MDQGPNPAFAILPPWTIVSLACQMASYAGRFRIVEPGRRGVYLESILEKRFVL